MLAGRIQRKKVKIHILGICGTFMGGLARILLQEGYEVTGSDKAFYPPMSEQLGELGIEIFEGYQGNLPQADQYVIGNALSRGNPWVEEILQNGLSYSSGPEILGSILKKRKVIAVAGTHGKTTTSYMIKHILSFCGIPVDYLIGGISRSSGFSADNQNSEIFVIEADEYDSAFFDKRSKFLHYHPDIFVINNIEFDHADIFNSIDDIKRQFHHAIRTIPSNGFILFPNDDSTIKQVLELGIWSEKIAINCSDTLFLSSKKSIQSVASEEFDTKELPFVGKHNLFNAMMAMQATKLVGVSYKASYEALKQFGGVKRRLEIVYTSPAHIIYDDFAHHPTAIMATTQALLEKHEGKRIGAIIELASNTMASGYHDQELLEAPKGLSKVIWVDQKAVLKVNNSFKSLDLAVAELKKSFKDLDILVIMTNKNSKVIKDCLIEAMHA